MVAPHCKNLVSESALVVDCQDELSLHLLLEEAGDPWGSLSNIMLLPVPFEPESMALGTEGITFLVGAVLAVADASGFLLF